MPFKSERQRRWMWKNKPELARRWTKNYGSKVKAAKKKHRRKKQRSKR